MRRFVNLCEHRSINHPKLVNCGCFPDLNGELCATELRDVHDSIVISESCATVIKAGVDKLADESNLEASKPFA